MLVVNSAMGRNTGVIAIEYGVPIPPTKAQGRWVEVLNEMDVGASFLASAGDSLSFQKAARRKGGKVAIRWTSENNDRPFRVWLVAKKEGADEPVR